MVLNVSVSLAVYALMTLYHAFQAELAPHRPLAQILCIKVRTKRMQHIRTSTRLMPRMCGYCVASQGVVFFAFWQSMLVELAEYMGWLHQDHWWVCGVEGDAHCSPHTSVCIGRWCLQVLHGRIGRRSSGEQTRPAQPSPWVVAPRLINCGVVSAAGCAVPTTQNLLVCVEMGLLFAFANNYAFTADPYAKRAAAIRKSHTE